MWANTTKCTVQLAAESDRERAIRVVQELQAEEEQLLDKFTEDLYNGTNGSNDQNDEDDRNSKDGAINPGVLAQTMDEDRDMNKDGDDDYDGGDGGNGGNGSAGGAGSYGGNGNVAAGDIARTHLPGVGVDLNATIRVCANVKKCAVNEIVLNQDVVGYAKVELAKLNLEKTRVCERARRMRMKELSTAVMDSVSLTKHLDDDGFDYSSENRDQHLQASIV